MIGVDSVPVECSDALTGALGAAIADDALLRDVAQRARNQAGRGEDRAELVGLLTARALLRAFERSDPGAGVAA